MIETTKGSTNGLKWTDSTQWDYATDISGEGVYPWYYGQPDHGGENENCAQLFSDFEYKLDDESCDESKNFCLCSAIRFMQFT